MLSLWLFWICTWAIHIDDSQSLRVFSLPVKNISHGNNFQSYDSFICLYNQKQSFYDAGQKLDAKIYIEYIATQNRHKVHSDFSMTTLVSPLCHGIASM